VVDESWAIANRGNGRFDPKRLIGAGIVLYLAWVAATDVGALGASLLADSKALGLDAAFPALFLTLLWPQARERRAAAAAALGAGIALVTLPVAPLGLPIIAAAAACLLGVRR
jgi:predicted branched-subunit amino acid permease